MGIFLGRRKAFMPQKLLDSGQISPIHDQMACKSVPQVVEFEILYPCSLEGRLEGALDIFEGSSFIISEYIGIFEPSGDPLEGLP